MKTTKNRNTVTDAYEQIVDNIIHFNLKPGEVVTENSLAEKFNLGRTPVREALKRLEVEGLIITEGRTKKVYFLTSKDIEDIFNIKIVLESNVARWAASKATDKQLNDLANVMLSMKALGDNKVSDNSSETYLTSWLALDARFHELLFDMVDNQKITPVVKNLNIQWHRLKVGITAIEGRIEKAIVEHCKIGNAILERKEEQAAKEMTQHLESLKMMILRIMQMFS